MQVFHHYVSCEVVNIKEVVCDLLNGKSVLYL